MLMLAPMRMSPPVMVSGPWVTEPTVAPPMAPSSARVDVLVPAFTMLPPLLPMAIRRLALSVTSIVLLAVSVPPLSVSATAAEAGTAPSPRSVAICKVPALTVTMPVKVFTPVKAQVPASCLVKVPAPVPMMPAMLPPWAPPKVRFLPDPLMVPVLPRPMVPEPPMIELSEPSAIRPA